MKIKTFGLTFLLGYVVFIPSGPFPIYIAGGLKLDVLFGGLLLLFLLSFHVGKIQQLPNILLASYSFYLAAILISTILSEDIQRSSLYAMIMVGYSLIALLVPLVFTDKADIIRRWMFIVAGLVGLLIIVLYYFFGFAQSHRFALALADLSKGAAWNQGVAVVDPNMTAAGLLLSIIVYVPCLMKKRISVFWEIMVLVCIIGGALILLSRSAILGFVLAMLVAALVVLSRKFMIHGFFVKKTAIYGLLLIMCVSVTVVFLFPHSVDRVVGRISRAGEDSIRFVLLNNALDVFSSTLKSVLFGNGFMTTNPHNEFMRTLSSMGLFGVVSKSLFLLAMFYCALRRIVVDERKFFSGVAITVFVLVITLFYGYTKLVWVAWMFLLILYRESLSMMRRLLLSK